MAAHRLVIEITGSEPQEIRISMAAMMTSERRFGKDAFQEHPIEAGLLSAWFSLGMPGGKDGFEEWALTVESVSQVEDPPEATDSSGPSPQFPQSLVSPPALLDVSTSTSSTPSSPPSDLDGHTQTNSSLLSVTS